MKKLSLIKFCSGLGAVLLLVFWGRIFEVQAQTGALSIGSTTRDVNIIRRLGIGSTSPIALLGISPVTNTEGLRIVASNYSPLVISNSSGADLFRTKEDGNVGIGTSNPQQKLHVVGSILSSSLVNATSSCLYADANGKISLQGAPCGTGGGGLIGSGQDNYVAKWSGAGLTNGIIYDNGNNVGIGTTAPNQKLDVAGVINASTGFKINNAAATTGTYLRGNGTNFVAASIQSSDIPVLNQNTTGSAYYLVSRDTRAVNDLPQDYAALIKFDFKQNTINGLSDGGTYNGVMTWRKYGGIADLSGGPVLQLAYTDNGNLWTRLSAGTSTWAAWTKILNTNTGVALQSSTPGTAQSGNINISGAALFGGNVGIGTTTPSSKLYLNGGNLTVNNGTIAVTDVKGGHMSGLNLTPTNPDHAVPLAYLQNNYSLWKLSGNNLYASSTAWNLGIGTTAPTEKLTVNGNTYSSGSFLAPNITSFKSNGDLTNTIIGPDSTQIAQSPIAGFIWHDILAFNNLSTPVFETSANGSSWSAGTLDKKLFAQKENQSVVVLDASSLKAVRWTWSSGVSWSLASWMVLGFTWNSPAVNVTVTIDSSSDGTNWTNRHTSNIASAVTYPYWLYISPFNGDTYLRLTMTSNSSSGLVSLSTMRLLTSRWGNQGAGSELSYPYTWDENKNIFLPANVGIGTTNPAAKLHIDGGIRSTSLVNATSSCLYADANGAISLLGAPCGSGGGGVGDNLGNHTASQNVRMNGFWLSNDGGDEGVFVKTDGNVGIGTTGPQAKLHIQGNIATPHSVTFNHYEAWGSNATRPYLSKSWASTPGDYLYLGSTGNTSNTAQTAMLLTSSEGVKFGRGADTVNGVFATEWMRINTSGNIGIGTTNPGSKLTIVGGGGTGSGGPAVLDITATDSATYVWGSAIMAPNLTAGQHVISPFMGVAKNANNSGYMSFKYAAAGSTSNALTWGFYSNDDKMVLLASGNVGIGTTNPTAKLTVADSVLVKYGGLDVFSASNDYILLNSGVGVGTVAKPSNLTVMGDIYSSNLGGSGDRCLYVNSLGQISAKTEDCGTGSASGWDHIATQNITLGNYWLSGDGGNEGVFVKSDGNVGIGITNPAFPLDAYRAAGNTGTSTQISASAPSGASNGIAGYNIKIDSSNLWQLITDNTLSSPMQNAFFVQASGNKTNGRYLTILTNGNVGIGTTSPSYKLAVAGDVGATRFQYSSDLRLKTNIRTIANPLEKIMQLRGVSFNWRADDNPSLGLIAQEVEKVFPEIVSGEEFKSVGYGNLVAPLIEAVKEQQRIIDRLEARINILEIKNRR